MVYVSTHAGFVSQSRLVEVPSDIWPNPPGAHFSVETEGTARGFNPLAGFRVHRASLTEVPSVDTLRRGGTAAARRALPKRTAVTGLISARAYFGRAPTSVRAR